ncbi:MAG: hypothetical protein J6334_04970 [Kiritimatiellae bacterium]|nr:hypothetical protein [Kiritimatiellia bacterium]
MMRRLAGITCLSIGLALPLSAREQPIEIRVTPDPAVTAAYPLRLSLPLGFLEGAANPFQSERLTAEPPNPSPEIRLDPIPDRESYTLSNNHPDRFGSLTWLTHPLRAGTDYRVLVKGAAIEGPRTVILAATPLEERGDRSGHTGKIAFRPGPLQEKALFIRPAKNGPYQLTLQIPPGGRFRIARPSCKPREDGDSPWDGAVLEAFRRLAPEEIRWPVAEGLGFYNWYDGVGPREVRRVANPMGAPQDGHPFGTAEYVAFCRRLEIPPRIRVIAFTPQTRRKDVPSLEAALALAADWVAYCNATNSHPMARLRTEHGHPEPLNVSRWEIACADGQPPDPDLFARYRAVMLREDPSLDLRPALPTLLPESDRYTAELFARFRDAEAREAAYFAPWYRALGVVHAFLNQPARQNAEARLYLPFTPNGLLLRHATQNPFLTEQGHLVALMNQYPMVEPLRCTFTRSGNQPDAPLAARAAWIRKPNEMEILICNTLPERKTLTINLEKLNANFLVWVSEQLAGQIAQPRTTDTLPVNQLTRAGAAMLQTFSVTVEPASCTRLIIKR